MVNRIPITEARVNLGAVVKRVHLNGEYFILEKDGIPVAGIMGADEARGLSGTPRSGGSCADQEEQRGYRGRPNPSRRTSARRTDGDETREAAAFREAMNGFDVRTTAHFERALKKLARAHPQLRDEYRAFLTITRTDPYNRTRRYPIKKLEGVRAGEGQYRIRMRRFRFIYDVEGQTVFFKACGLRREDAYC